MPKGVYARRPLADRFWEKVDRSGGPDACWPWLGAGDDEGYGFVQASGRQRRAHVVAWELDTGRDMPPGKKGCHSCDHPPCCNPRHVFEGTHQENMQDAARKGRTRRGPRNGRAKLTEDQVRYVLSRKGLVTARHLAPELGVSRTAVRLIWNGTNWRWLSNAA